MPRPSPSAPPQVPSTSPLFLAANDGIFARHGLDVKSGHHPAHAQPPRLPFCPVPFRSVRWLSTTYPASRRQWGSTWWSSPGARSPSPAVQNVALLRRQRIRHANRRKTSLAGKVGMPGLGAFMHVTLRWWLDAERCRLASHQLRRNNFPHHARPPEIRRRSTRWVRLTLTPAGHHRKRRRQRHRLFPQGRSRPASHPSSTPATRDWAVAHPEQRAAFRAAIADAIAIIRTDPDLRPSRLWAPTSSCRRRSSPPPISAPMTPTSRPMGLVMVGQRHARPGPGRARRHRPHYG